MIIRNNMMALTANRQMALNMVRLQTSVNRLSSGYRINSAADDAAGLAISERMRAQSTGLERAMMNAHDANNLVQTGEGALGEVNRMLNRLGDLAGQAANGTLQDSQRKSIQNEANEILKEINRVSQATNFNGIKLLDGSLSGSGGQDVSVKGLRVEDTAAVAGQYDYSTMPDITGLKAGDEVAFTMALNNSSSHTVKLKVSDDLTRLTAADGTSYALSPAAGASTVDASSSVVAGAVADQLGKTAAGSQFNIQQSGGALQLTNREAGTSAPQVGSFSYRVDSGGAVGTSQSITATIAPPADEYRSVNKEAFTVFDGTNEAAAVFEMGGSRFAVIADTANYGEVLSKLEGMDVNVIKVEGTSGSGLTTSDLAHIAGEVNQKTGLALETRGDDILLKSSSGSQGGLTMQIGDTAAPYNRINVSVADMSTKGLGLNSLDFTSQAGASSALSRINAATDKVTSARGDLGATQNRLTRTIDNLGVTFQNITEAESRIRDVDMAKEMTKFAKYNLLSQVSQSMLAQANMQPQMIMQLLR